MAKLELPILAFVEDFVRRAFPNRDWSRGSAVGDLVIQPMATILQPLRQEIDAIKINQSVANYPFMNREDLDALAANWAKFRQTGGRSIGNVRLFFDRAADYEFNFLEFFSTDGTEFVLQAPIRITARELLANRRSDNTFFFDVPVQSVGKGSRFALSAGSIVGIRNGPPSIIRVTNVEDFQVTAPDESNFDVVNSMYRNLSMRNLVSRASIRAPLLENFPGILDIFVAGPDHVNMVRDIETVTINGRDVQLHLGGMTDVWVNTNGVIQRQVNLSYLPSSKEVKIVSAEQVQANSLVYAFSRLLLDIEGRYSAFEFPEIDLDESVGIFIDQIGIPIESFVIDTRKDDQYRLSSEEVVSGSDMVPLPVPTGLKSVTLTDIFGINLNNTAVEAGDMIRLGDNYHRIVAKSGRVVSLSSKIDVESPTTYDDTLGVVESGDRQIPLLNADTIARLNDRLVVTRGTAQGHYRVLAVDTNDVWVGNPRARVDLTYSSDDSGEVTYDVTAVGGGTPEIPYDVDTNHWISFNDDGGYDQTGTWSRVVSVLRSSGGLQIVTEGGPTAGTHTVDVVQGLRGALEDETVLYFERSDEEQFDQVMRQDFDTGHTLYNSVLDSDLQELDNELYAIGIGQAAKVGDLIVFDAPGTIPIEDTNLTGGDGTKFSVFVSRILDDDNVEFKPALSFSLAENLRFSLVRNNGAGSALASLTADNVSGSLTTFNSWPLGLGDGLGMGIRATATIVSDQVDSVTQNGDSLLVSFSGSVDLSDARPGDNLVVAGTATALDGTHPILVVDAINETVIIEGAPIATGPVGSGTADVEGTRVSVINSSTAGDTRTLKFEAPQDARTLTFAASNYVSPSLADIGSAVTQTVGGTTYAGVLHSFDNTLRQWTVIPNDPASDVFAVHGGAGEEVEVVNSSASGECSNTGSLFDIGYFDPIPSDIGLIVRQGTYTGVLDSYTGAPDYEWKIKPLSEFDLFDQTDVLTFVDRGSGSATPNEAQGILRVPATEPEINTGTVVVTTDLPAAYGTGDTVDIISRFGRHAGFFDGSRFRVYDDGVINVDPFAGVNKDTDKLVVLTGGNFDVYDIADVGDDYIDVSNGAPFSDFVRIANAPPRQTLQLAGTIAAGSTSLTVPGSGLGVFAHAGRILILTYSGITVRLVIDGPNGQDGLFLKDPIPSSLFPSQSIEFEVVEAFHLAYFIVPEASLQSYRVFRAPTSGSILLDSSTGSHTNNIGTENKFVDSDVNFLSIIGYSDFDLEKQELLLFIDDGPEASVTPYEIVGVDNETTLLLDHTFTTSAGPVSYHIVRRNRMGEREEWIDAEIVANDTLKLDVPVTWSPNRFGTYRDWQVVISHNPGLVGTLQNEIEYPTATIADYDAGTRELTLDLASDHIHEVDLTPEFDTSISASPVGFQDSTMHRRVRVMVRPIDKVDTLAAQGSAVNTFNYYADGEYFVLPIVRIQSVVRLDPETLQPTTQVPYTLDVDDEGLRYSHLEENTLRITEAGNDIIFQPLRVTYLADPSIENIDNYLKDPDTRVINANPLAKRMETISASVEIEVRSEKSVAELQNLIASYVNNLDSTQRLSKDGIIKFLYQEDAVSFIDTDSLVLNATYFKFTGELVEFDDVSEVFGSDTAAYLSNAITVTKITELN